MNDNEKVIDYVSGVQQLYSQLTSSGVTTTEEMLVARIVSGLARQFRNFISNRSDTPDSSQTMAELVDHLISYCRLVWTIC